ncbi:oligoendopeptidase [Fictibacillus macauensis ZFHKF-1]|uniref:Oligoendopeptidase n=1 Tax=Fictibacillus macauensis ZFHKF-1 TaxID=1196324 RepID=I8ADN5_9BACL|nr:M3 family oligoendopeptidase [Fictibacillus macauensis]EIT83667.1 oligoendopeptidase [Fictibacillus macauensis ZFHKF-1]
MKFSQYTYERPQMEELTKNFHQELQLFTEAATFQAQDEAMSRLMTLRNHFETMESLAHVRYTTNTNDVFYREEKAFFDDVTPSYQGLISEFFQALTSSTFRNELENKWNPHLFALAQAELQTYSPAVEEKLKEENKRVSAYVKLLASAQIDFQGEKRTLSQLIPFTQSPDREVRRAAVVARFQFFEENKDTFDEMYDALVTLRTAIAKELGFNSYTELAYQRLHRTDYTKEDVKAFRQQVKEHLVPFCNEMREKQRQRIGVESLRFHDDTFSFPDGNPKPQGDADWIVKQAGEIFKEMSPETDTFYQFMEQSELLDLVSKEGKAPGGYCTYMTDFGAPFIFANFNGSQGDVKVLLHEAGHAFQAYSSRHFQVPEYLSPTLEACEIHSMSMEFLAYPWLEQLFGEETARYKYDHLMNAVKFIPYGVAVDEFQHWVYEYPEATPAERKEAWRNIEREYLPHRNYDGISFLEEGGFWQNQPHIYKRPFYYIDYTLAQICALQFWQRSRHSFDEAWQAYYQLCCEGGSKPFTELLKVAGLQSPFKPGCVETVLDEVRKWEAAFDESSLQMKS